MFREKIFSAFMVLLLLTTLFYGCIGPKGYLQEADDVAYRIIAAKQKEALGAVEPFTVEPPAEAFRKRLFDAQGLPYSHPASLGAGNLDPPAKWPDIHDENAGARVVMPPWGGSEPCEIGLLEALQIGARNNRGYQTRKEEVFRQALALDLERNEFRHTFAGLLESMLSSDLSGDETVGGIENRLGAAWTRRFKSGVELSSAIAIDLVKLLSSGRESSLGILADVSISIPLLRGAGKYIVAEPLTQAERNTVYAIYRFERFKRNFAVEITGAYLSVLERHEEVVTTEENYRNLVIAANRSRRLADSGRISEVGVDQAVQNALRAKDRWISNILAYEAGLDAFKILLGLPPDATFALDNSELERLASAAEKLSLQGDMQEKTTQSIMATLTLDLPDRAAAIPFDLDENEITLLALANRLDLRISQGQVYDSQRQVVVASNGLLPELTILGITQAGDRRSLESAASPNAELRPDEGFYSALLSLDLPFERTAERNAFRNSLLDLEQAVRDLQEKEDQVKLEIHNRLRDLVEFLERIRIQSQAVSVARRRVASTTLFLDAGRAQMRDLLDAQESLVQALNSLNSALVGYRIEELALQSDMGVLQVNSQGLYQEFNYEENNVGTH